MSAPFTREFPNTGADFSGLGDAARWLHDRRYNCGQLDDDKKPVAVLKADRVAQDFVPRWSLLCRTARAKLAGRITWKDGGPRDGTAVVTLKEAP